MRTVQQQTVKIKACRSRGGVIEWNYDSPQQASRLWRDLIETGRAPDTGESLETAAYFLGNSVKPTKVWDRVDLENLSSVSRMLSI